MYISTLTVLIVPLLSLGLLFYSSRTEEGVARKCCGIGRYLKQWCLKVRSPAVPMKTFWKMNPHNSIRKI